MSGKRTMGENSYLLGTPPSTPSMEHSKRLEAKDNPKERPVPNRTQLRQHGAGRKPFTGGQPFARLPSRARGSRASFYTLITLVQIKNGQVKKITIPRDKFERNTDANTE